MSTAPVFQTIQRAIRDATGEAFTLAKATSTGGGCINTTYRLEGEGHAYFVKLNREELLSMFEAEAEGLREILSTAKVRAPRPICSGVDADQAFLVMESLNLHCGRGACDRLLGPQLAAMHRVIQPFFGWHRDNTIGSTPQPNPRHGDWIEFWSERRLGFQLKLAKAHGYGGKLQREGEKLLMLLPAFFSAYDPKPSLLHGDLWAGNYAADELGQPVIFDPACYYGDREADIAMTELFGGFGRDFYSAYQEAFPLDSGYSTRKTLYNLYHVINHLNLFGGGYLSQAEDMIARLLSELG